MMTFFFVKPLQAVFALSPRLFLLLRFLALRATLVISLFHPVMKACFGSVGSIPIGKDVMSSKHEACWPKNFRAKIWDSSRNKQEGNGETATTIWTSCQSQTCILNINVSVITPQI